MREPLKMYLFVVIAATLGAGCAPRVVGATAIQPAVATDTPHVWIYLRTDDDTKDGVYRCSEADGKPVCKRAKILAPCTRDHCGD
jgi:hypothetical protein